MDERDPKPSPDDVTMGGFSPGTATASSGGLSAGPPNTPTPASGPGSAVTNMNVNLMAILNPGTVLGGRYEILQMLGLGGMGAVYKAQDRELDRTIALKVIRPDLASSPEALARFKQELLTARQVTHRNVIRIFDIGEADGIKFITMEYLVGTDLRVLLAERGKLPPEEAMGIIQQVCAGLAAAHSEGIIHRDLKPGNIMLDSQGRVVVMDFGLARSLQSDGMTQTGAMLGTVEYMSPEQAKAEKLDGRSDIFTIGLILYELLTGKMPFKADSAIASLLKRTQERASAVTEHDPTIPASLSDVVSKCLERDPNLRFQSAQEMFDRLDEIRGRRPVSVYGPVPGIAPKRKPWLAIGIAAVLLVVAAIGAAFFLRSRPTATGPAHSTVTVLLADFENATAEDVFEGTLEPAFGLALEGAPFISTYNRTQARKIANQIKPGAHLGDADARLVAAREGINVVISGSVAKDGGGYKVSCKATDAITGKVIDTEAVTANDKSSVLKEVGAIAGKLRVALGDTTPESVRLAQQETYTSSSLEAAHEYAQAQEYRYSGKGPEAIKGFLKAIQSDPNFGSAYGSLAAVYWNQGNQPDAIKYYKLAMQHVDRMTDREKYRTRGGYYLAVADGDKAVEEFSALVKQYPADSMGLSALAFAYYLKHDMANAMEASHRAMQVYPRNVVYHNNEALYALFAGNYDTAEREAKNVLEINPSYDKAMITVALVNTARGNFDQATEVWHKVGGLSAIGASYEANGLADLALYRSDAAAAIAMSEKGIALDQAAKNTNAAAKKLVVLAEAQLMAGKKAEAVRSLDRAVAMDQTGVLFPAARAYAMAGQDTKALALASKLAQQLDPLPQAYAKLIEGDVQLNRGHAREALQLYQQSDKITDTWLARFELARAYVALNSFTDANAELDRCIKRRGEATDIYVDEQQTFRYFPPTFYYQGMALQGLNSPGAAEAFKNFLALKVKDSEDPLVADARKRSGGN